MSEDIPFDKSFDLPPDRVEEVMPGVRRMLVDNPGPFTFKGTLSYIVGTGRVAIIDPGPIDEAHIAALLDAVRGETVTHILVTHTHRDHSCPRAVRIKAATGAMTCGEGRTVPRVRSMSGEAPRLEASADRDFHPSNHWCSPMARPSAGRAGRWKPSRRPATPPITWPMRSPARACCFPATMSWPGRPRSWRRPTAP